MKLLYKNLKLHQLILIVTANLLLVSCGTYQSIYNDDGIYSDENTINEDKKVVVVVDEEPYKDYEGNYFTKKLEALESIDSNELFTDVDSYNSDDRNIDDEVIDEALNYNANQPWGYENNDVVVHINLINDPYWMGYNNWNWEFQNPWAFRRGFRNWGYNNYWNPYHRNMAWNLGLYNPYYYNRPWNNYRYNRNYSYGRRVTNNTYSRRNSNTNSRVNRYSNKRNNTRVNRNTSNTAIRNHTNTSSTRATKPSSRTRKKSSNSRNNSSTRRSTSNRNNNSRSASSSSGRRSPRSSSTRSSGSRSSGSRRSSSSSKKRGN
jgi:uncharacterized membrane protein YgcG